MEKVFRNYYENRYYLKDDTGNVEPMSEFNMERNEWRVSGYLAKLEQSRDYYLDEGDEEKAKKLERKIKPVRKLYDSLYEYKLSPWACLLRDRDYVLAGRILKQYEKTRDVAIIGA